MAALATHNIVDAGTKPTFVAASTSDTVEIGNGHNVVVIYKNTDATTEAISVLVPGLEAWGTPTADNTQTIAATNGELWIPMRKDYDDGSGRATITMASATGVTVAVVKVG